MPKQGRYGECPAEESHDAVGVRHFSSLPTTAHRTSLVRHSEKSLPADNIGPWRGLRAKTVPASGGAAFYTDRAEREKCRHVARFQNGRVCPDDHGDGRSSGNGALDSPSRGDLSCAGSGEARLFSPRRPVCRHSPAGRANCADDARSARFLRDLKPYGTVFLYYRGVTRCCMILLAADPPAVRINDCL